MTDKSPDPELALGVYLDAMLQGPAAEAGVAPPVLTRSPVLLPEWLLEPSSPGLDAPTAVGMDGLSPTGGGAALAVDGAAEAGVFAPAAAGENNDAEPGRALAASGYLFPLQCLMFRLGRHLMGMPLVGLGSVHQLRQALSRLPESPPGVLGMVDVRGSSLQVVDALHLLSGGHESNADCDLLLVLNASRWAMNCSRIEEIVSLEADEVKWSQRKLRLGTIRHSLAVLLDPGAIVKQLDSAGRRLDDFG